MTVSHDVAIATRDQAGGRAPDFFIVGHPKCGTTALYEMLKCHPQIFMPDLKEPWFFAPELRIGRSFGPAARRPGTLAEYEAVFAPARPGQIAGEATPSYLKSELAAGRIAELCPDARIVAILREPASFLRSLHFQFVQMDIETENDLRTAIALEPRRRAGEALPRNSARPKELLYSEHVRFVEQLRRYHDAFSPNQVLVMIYDDFRANNERAVRQVQRFLGVDDSPSLEVTEANPTIGIRSPRVKELVRALYLGRSPAARAAKLTIKALTPQPLRHAALAIERRAQANSPRPPDEQLMVELRHRFKGEVVALSEYLGRDLVALWGYDQIP
jgi:hypothetical protein